MKKIDWNSLLLTIIIIIAIIAICTKALINYEESKDSWKVKTVNYGFAIVIDTEGDEVLVRNPVPGLKAGDPVIVKGFTLDSNFPYIDSRKK